MYVSYVSLQDDFSFDLDPGLITNSLARLSAAHNLLDMVNTYVSVLK